jgi:hypothetical protein
MMRTIAPALSHPLAQDATQRREQMAILAQSSTITQRSVFLSGGLVMQHTQLPGINECSRISPAVIIHRLYLKYSRTQRFHDSPHLSALQVAIGDILGKCYHIEYTDFSGHDVCTMLKAEMRSMRQ